MSLTYPLGMLALIAIPVLILIYIIKNKYTEKTVSSTYLWTLSEQFIKKRMPISRIVGILSLILQILAVVLIAFSISHPSFVLPRAAKEYCFILDGSGSMTATDGDATRFEEGKAKIASMIDESTKGSVYSLIYVGKSSQTVYRGYSDKGRALRLLNDLDVSYCSSTVTDALGVAQEIFDENPSVAVYLVTDKSYTRTENISVINVSNGGNNYAVSEVSYGLADGKLNVACNVISYENPAKLELELYLDGASQPTAKGEVDVKTLSSTPYTFSIEGRTELRSARVVVKNADIQPLDNEAIVYNVDYENSSRTLLVSDYPFYIQAGLLSTGNSQIDVVKTEDYTDRTGYDLYIFDSFTPAELPKDGAVWFFNPQSSLSGTNFNFQDVAYPSKMTEYSKSTAHSVQNLLSGVSKKGFVLSKYVKCGLSGKFTSLISVDGNPLIFAGLNAYGNREVVFAFDLHDSATFTLSADLSTIMANLLNYSFPLIIDGTSYYCGDTLGINVLPGTSRIEVESPTGKKRYPDTGVDVSEYELDEAGSYTVTITMKDRSVRKFNVFASLPEQERVPAAHEKTLLIRGTAENNMMNGIYDELLIFFIVLAVIVLADYGVYLYEQYQLR